MVQNPDEFQRPNNVINKKGTGMPGKAKILLMDDEQVILEMTRDVLNFLMYDVMFAKEGTEAIDLYKREKAAGVPFDIVILDLSVTRGLGGKETIEQLRLFDPEVKAIISSGFTNDPVVEDFSRYGFCERLTKPYSLSDLKKLLENVMKKTG
jgi:DNA-binding NtrC family response regulator